MKLTRPDVRTIMVIFGTLSVILQTVWPSERWSIAATMVITAVFVHVLDPVAAGQLPILPPAAAPGPPLQGPAPRLGDRHP